MLIPWVCCSPGANVSGNATEFNEPNAFLGQATGHQALGAEVLSGFVVEPVALTFVLARRRFEQVCSEWGQGKGAAS